MVVLAAKRWGEHWRYQYVAGEGKGEVGFGGNTRCFFENEESRNMERESSISTDSRRKLKQARGKGGVAYIQEGEG